MRLNARMFLWCIHPRRATQLSARLDFNKPLESMNVVMPGFMFAAMFLVMLLMDATTIAAESFAGERGC